MNDASAVGTVLSGFKEHAISFPPSFRRQRGPRGDCLDYTDLKRLRDTYTTMLKRKSGKGPGKLRVPSYTDRILVHSLPDLEDEISLQAYELCDVLWGSDHRPVSALLHLKHKPAPSLSPLRKSRPKKEFEDSETQPAPAKLKLNRSSSSSLEHPLNICVRIENLNVDITATNAPLAYVHSHSDPIADDSDKLPPSPPKTARFFSQPAPFTALEDPPAPAFPPSVPPRPVSLCLSKSSSEPKGQQMEVAGVLAVFPLPSEDRVTFLRGEAVQMLDSHFKSKVEPPDLSRSELMNGVTYMPWDEARQKGLELSAQVMGGTDSLHVLLKLVDSRGRALGMTTVPVPLDTQERRRAVSGPLTRHTAYVGSWSCEVERPR